MVNRWLNVIQFALFPPHCLLCGDPGQPGQDLCVRCAAALPRHGDGCPRCALPLPDGAPKGLPCGRCGRHPPPYLTTRAAFLYADPVDLLVQGLKFRGRLAHARLLGELLAEHLAAHLVALPDVIVPVPLHPRRQRTRGFNQSVELARPVSRRLGVPLHAAGARRLRDTAAQTGLASRARRDNLRGAFAADPALCGLHVAIVDDVVTTGHTVVALARALRGAGAARVDVWCVARALAPGQAARA